MKTLPVASRFIAQALAACLLCASAASATSPADAARPGDQFDEAMDLYSLGRWTAAYGRFTALADQGHREAARISVLMVRHGASLYGQSLRASPPQVRRWIQLATEGMEALKAEAGD